MQDAEDLRVVRQLLVSLLGGVAALVGRCATAERIHKTRGPVCPT